MSPTPTLYQVLGADDGIRCAVDVSYERVLADPDLAAYFAGADMISLRLHQTDMLVTATGGPPTYTGQDMAEAHHGLEITECRVRQGRPSRRDAPSGRCGRADHRRGHRALSPLRSAIVSA